MLIKRVPAGEITEAQPILWRQTGTPVAGAGSALPPPATPSIAPGRDTPKELSREVSREDPAQAERLALQKRIAELEASLEQRCREARDTGYREGETAGRNQANTQVGAMMEKLARSIQEIAEARPKLRAEAERDLLKLSLAIARKILHRELSADPDSIAGLIKVCLDKIRLQEIVRVRIHPQHHPPIQQMLARLSTGVPIELLPDPKLQLGGVVIETTRGEFDASVDVQLKEIERGLTDLLRSRA
jgi:flagellar assembly protein FliH